MSTYLRFAAFFLATASLLTTTTRKALATPELSFGMSCAACHTTQRDALHVDGDPETLPTFTVEAGQTVQLSFDVYRQGGVFEEFEYIVGVSGLTVPGLAPSLGSDWEFRSGETFSYVLDDEHEDPDSYILNVAVDPSTLGDLYLMEAIVAGHDEEEEEKEIKWFDSEPFYLRVISQSTEPQSTVPEPSTLVLLASLAAGLSLNRVRLNRKTYSLR